MFADQTFTNSNYITKSAVLAKYAVTESILNRLEERNPGLVQGGSGSRWRVTADGKTYFHEPAISKLFKCRESKELDSYQEALRGTFPASDPLPSWACGSREVEK